MSVVTRSSRGSGGQRRSGSGGVDVGGRASVGSGGHGGDEGGVLVLASAPAASAAVSPRLDVDDSDSEQLGDVEAYSGEL